MNRAAFQRLARARLREADALLDAKQWSGAYYLAGYSVECALKAVIVRQFKGGTLPDRNAVSQTYTHDLARLVVLAGLSSSLSAARSVAGFQVNWLLVQEWNEASRYATWSKEDALGLVSAIRSTPEGVLPWLISCW